MENNQAQGQLLAAPGHRIGAAAVDAGLYIVTLGIGWAIWDLVMWSRGQTPGKNLLKVRVMNQANGRPASWGHMCIRQALIPSAISLSWYLPYIIFIAHPPVGGARIALAVVLAVAALLVIGLGILDLVWLFGPDHKRLIDYWAKTYVVNEAPNLSQMIYPQRV